MITILKSVIIGICALLPGISGSVIAVTLGIYDKFLNSIKTINNIKKNIIFLIEVIIGTIIGIIISSYVLIVIFKYQTIIYYILSGIILSELPFIIKNIHAKNGRIRYVSLLLAFIFSYALELVNSNYIEINSNSNYFIGGIFFAFGKIFPGISSSFFLLCLGIYQNIIILVTNPLLLFKNFSLYFPFMIGTVFGLLVFYRLLSYLLNNKYDFIYSVIIGFILSSTLILMPKFEFKVPNIIGFTLMLAFFVLFVRIKEKKDS